MLYEHWQRNYDSAALNQRQYAKTKPKRDDESLTVLQLELEDDGELPDYSEAVNKQRSDKR